MPLTGKLLPVAWRTYASQSDGPGEAGQPPSLPAEGKMAQVPRPEAFVPGMLNTASDPPLWTFAEDLGWRHKLGRQVTSPNQSGFGIRGHGFRLGQAGRWRRLSQKRGATRERV